MAYFETSSERRVREQMCDIGRRIWARGLCAGNEGNHSARIALNRILCTPTGLSKGQLRPEDICVVDLRGNQVSGTRARTSEIHLHLAIYSARPDVRAVIHAHPPHATAFAVSGAELPTSVHPEAELFLGPVRTARYVTPGDARLGESILPFVHDSNTILLQSHGAVTFAADLETAYYNLEILEAYARLLMLAGQVGGARQLSSADMQELLELKSRLGKTDPRSGKPRLPVAKSLDQKLARIHADPHGAGDFILADAKDADMSRGVAAPGVDPRTGKLRSLADYRDQMREIVRQGLVDIMLMSPSSSEILTIQERLFADSTVTPAVRANDTTDIHLPCAGAYADTASRPFRSTTIDQIQSGRLNPSADDRRLGPDLGLYSITPNNRVEDDLPALEAYRDFRIEAESKGFRHFLEVFDPNVPGRVLAPDVGRFVNDFIVRTLAGVVRRSRPLFLKIAYHGPAAMEELAAYDPTLVPGILGGAAGTTFDAFFLLEEARKHGARAALFGRKINQSEHPLTFVRFLNQIAQAQLGASEAVKAYHGELQKLGIAPLHKLKDDLAPTEARRGRQQPKRGRR
jgi:L-ribulose-5-phosphate 4-epimerase